MKAYIITITSLVHGTHNFISTTKNLDELNQLLAQKMCITQGCTSISEGSFGLQLNVPYGIFVLEIVEEIDFIG